LFDLNAADAVSIATAALSALCIYLAYDITRITSGAPKAWYVIILAFVVLLVRRITQAYFDILSPSNDIDIGEATITLVVVVLFVIGLFMLNRTFRKQLVATQEISQ
jgi:hydrogenase-4 membrane subunit HyfE